LSLAATTLIGLEILNFRNAADPQTADRYYFEQSWVPWLHYGAIAINVAVVGATMVGVFLSRRTIRTEPLVGILAYLGVLLAWSEIMLALRSQPTELYRLVDLPYRPMNNFGLLGAQIFVTYLVFKLPAGRLGAWQVFLLRTSLAIGAFLAQLLVYELVARP